MDVYLAQSSCSEDADEDDVEGGPENAEEINSQECNNNNVSKVSGQDKLVSIVSEEKISAFGDCSVDSEQIEDIKSNLEEQADSKDRLIEENRDEEDGDEGDEDTEEKVDNKGITDSPSTDQTSLSVDRSEHSVSDSSSQYSNKDTDLSKESNDEDRSNSCCDSSYQNNSNDCASPENVDSVKEFESLVNPDFSIESEWFVEPEPLMEKEEEQEKEEKQKEEEEEEEGSDDVFYEEDNLGKSLQSLRKATSKEVENSQGPLPGLSGSFNKKTEGRVEHAERTLTKDTSPSSSRRDRSQSSVPGYIKKEPELKIKTSNTKRVDIPVRHRPGNRSQISRNMKVF